MEYHQPVLLEESLKFLQIRPEGRYIDATLGDGGHSVAMLKLGGTVLGLDVNQKSLDRAAERITEAGLSHTFIRVKGNFKHLESLAKQAGFVRVDGVLFDLGVSSTQLADQQMGLSFSSDAELNMRLDDQLGVKALDLINGLYESELADLFRKYGQERLAKQFAKEIVRARELEKLSSARQLAELARKAFPGYEKGRLHPATRIFMALRIAVNDELENLKSALPQAGRLLLPGGRMVVISFHSLEDKMVKEFAQGAQPCELREVVKGPVMPTPEEIAQNPRARSAKMRVLEKL